MERTTQSITVMEPVTYETSLLLGLPGPTLSQVYEMNGWPLARCQPWYHSHNEYIGEPHYFARSYVTDHDVGWKKYVTEADDPTWFIGGLNKSIPVQYWVWTPQDAAALGIKDWEQAKGTAWIRCFERGGKLAVSLPSQVMKEVERARASGLFTTIPWSYSVISGGVDYLAISYDHRIFELAAVKRPDPIIIGHGHDGRWHVIAAWNIDLDLEAISVQHAESPIR